MSCPGAGSIGAVDQAEAAFEAVKDEAETKLTERQTAAADARQQLEAARVSEQLSRRQGARLRL